MNIFSFFTEDITQEFLSGCLHDLRNEEVKVREEEGRRRKEKIEGWERERSGDGFS